MVKRRYAGVLLFCIPPIFAAAIAFPTTHLTRALTGWPAAHQPATVIYLDSTAAVVQGMNPISTSGIGTPIGHTSVIIMIDVEAMCVNGPVGSNGGVPVERGCQGTRVTGHTAGALAYVGPPSYYVETAPSGSCDANSLPVLPVVYIDNAGVYDCVVGVWVYQGQASKAVVKAPVWHVTRLRLPWYQRAINWVGRHL